jgi:hypothetical protein
MLVTASREIALLRTGPSEGTWRRLVEMIDGRRAAGEELGPLVEALRPEVARWPEDLRRTLPLSWVYRLAARGRLVEATLANDLVLSDRWALTQFEEFRPLQQTRDHDVEFGDEYDGVTPDERTEVERVFECPDLMGVRRLDMSFISDGNPYSPGPMVSLESTRELFSAPFLPRLRVLLLSHAMWWRDPVAGLVELLRRAPQLRELDLRDNDLDGHALVRLAGCPELARIERLRLDEDSLGRTVRHAFVRAGLERLVADIDEYGDEE